MSVKVTIVEQSQSGWQFNGRKIEYAHGGTTIVIWPSDDGSASLAYADLPVTQVTILGTIEQLRALPPQQVLDAAVQVGSNAEQVAGEVNDLTAIITGRDLRMESSFPAHIIMDGKRRVAKVYPVLGSGLEPLIGVTVSLGMLSQASAFPSAASAAKHIAKNVLDHAAEQGK
jgi:hypothetical protein